MNPNETRGVDFAALSKLGDVNEQPTSACATCMRDTEDCRCENCICGYCLTHSCDCLQRVAPPSTDHPGVSAREEDVTEDEMIARASVPSLADLYRAGLKSGVIQQKQAYA